MTVKFNKLRTLYVPVTHNHLKSSMGSRKTIDIYKVLLSKTECLEELHLHSADLVSDTTTPMSNRLECPLANLHPGAFATLTALSYTISIFHRFQASDILDPYHGLLRDDGKALKQLVALEALTISVWISRNDVHHFTLPFFKDAWLALPAVLNTTSQPMDSPFDKLKSLSVSVGACVRDNQQPKNLVRLIQDELFSARFRGLKLLAERRGIELTLDAPVRNENFANMD